MRIGAWVGEYYYCQDRFKLTLTNVGFTVRLVLAVSACSLTFFVAKYVLYINLNTGMYPINADSIGIPMFEVLFTSLICFAMMLASLLMQALASTLLIRPDLSVIYAAYFTRSSWKNFFTRSGDFSSACMCSVAAASPQCISASSDLARCSMAGYVLSSLHISP